MVSLILPIGALLLGTALLLLGSGLLNTLLPLRSSLEGYGDDIIGLIMSGYFLGFFAGTFLALPLIRRVGHIRAFASCAALLSCSALLHLFYSHPVYWFLLRILTGAVLVVLYTVTESWLNGQTSAEQRGRVFATYMAVNLGSLALAQQLLRLDSPAAFTLFVLCAMLMSVSLVPVAWTRLQQPEVAVVRRLGLMRLFRTAPVAAMGALLSGFAMGGFWGLGAVYAGRIGLDSGGVATFMSCAILGGAVFQLPLGRYSDSRDRRKVIAWVCASAVAAAILLAGLSYAGKWVLLAAALYGGLAFAVYPVAMAHLIDNLEPEVILSGGSGLLFLHGVGAAVGPALAGQLMAILGPQALPLYFAVMQGLMAFYAARNMQKLQGEPMAHPSHFVPMVRTTPTALEMLPEEQDERGVPG
ncbi:MAG: MFS transporter [Porticoccaceae bacterium]|nr:MFS transporter [Porticoccaceae bacterium]